VCLLNITGGDGVTTGTSIPLATYLSEVLYPTNSCLSAAGVVDRIEAFVLMRGIPLLVTFSSGYGYCSLAATLQLWLTPASVGSSELWIGMSIRMPFFCVTILLILFLSTKCPELQLQLYLHGRAFLS